MWKYSLTVRAGAWASEAIPSKTIGWAALAAAVVRKRENGSMPRTSPSACTSSRIPAKVEKSRQRGGMRHEFGHTRIIVADFPLISADRLRKCVVSVPQSPENAVSSAAMFSFFIVSIASKARPAASASSWWRRRRAGSGRICQETP